MSILKKNYILILSAIAGVALTSCNFFSSGLNFTKPEDVKNLNGMLQKAIKKDMVVQQIMFYQTNNSSFSMNNDMAQIMYVDSADSRVNHALDVNLKTGDISLNELVEKQHAGGVALKGVKLDNFDFSKIPVAVNAAIAEVQKENISADGLGSFIVDFNSGDITKSTYDFSLQHRTGSQRMGRSVRYTYDEYNFSADFDGNLIKK